MNLEELWKAALGEISLNIPKTGFNTWFKDSYLVERKGETVVLATSSNFACEWLKNKYHRYILAALRNLSPEIKQIEYIVINKTVSEKPESKSIQKIAQLTDEQLNLNDYLVDSQTHLNPRYTFENFVVGSHNELAHAAALVVSENLGTKYNPLFIYGGVGLGKTHLLQAIGNKIKKEKNKKIKIRYISSEKFASDLVSAIRGQTMEDFKKEFRNLDLLLIDDVQFVAGKDKTQEELFHIFNTLYEKNKQIVFTSDRPPKAIPLIEARLRSRFEGGMIADIGVPDFETRLAILRIKSQEKQLALSDDILQYIAQNIQKNIRELEGALNRIAAYSRLKNTSLTLPEAKQILSNVLAKPYRLVNAREVIKKTAAFYGLNEKDILQPSRKKDVVKPRQIIMYLLREELKSSYPYIGELMGGKDHTTVIHACNKIAEEINSNPELYQEISAIKDLIYSL